MQTSHKCELNLGFRDQNPKSLLRNMCTALFLDIDYFCTFSCVVEYWILTVQSMHTARSKEITQNTCFLQKCISAPFVLQLVFLNCNLQVLMKYYYYYSIENFCGLQLNSFFSLALMVTVLFWSLLYNYEEAPSYTNLFVHLLQSVVVLIDQ